MLRFVWISLAFCLIFVACNGKKGELKPFTETERTDLILIDQPQLVTFSDLQADPEMYQDRLIGVTGLYLRLPAIECFPHSGHGAEWALIDEALRLDAVGYESVTSLLPSDTLMTVEGIFRLYEGPIGCGKGAPPGTAWFLEVIKIIAPNPLSGPIVSGPGGFYPGATSIPEGPGSSPVSPDSTSLPASSTPGTLPPTASPVPTGTSALATPSLTATNISTTSPTPEQTPTGTLTVTPTPSNSPTGTLTVTPTPSSPSATPTFVTTPPIVVTPTDAYPGPIPPTSTPDPY